MTLHNYFASLRVMLLSDKKLIMLITRNFVLEIFSKYGIPNLLMVEHHDVVVIFLADFFSVNAFQGHGVSFTKEAKRTW